MTPGRLEQAILTGLVDYGITYLPSPDPALSYQEIGSFQFANYGTEKWLKKSFEDWEYAVPVTELKLNSIGVASLDMWPSSGPPRCIKYKFELLETALQMARTGNAVIHCPNFIIRLQNNFCKPEYQLHELATPSGYGMSRLIKVFLVSKKGMANKNMEGKFARFMRSIKV
jgi:DNA-binding transcriptional LysR family regulator